MSWFRQAKAPSVSRWGFLFSVLSIFPLNAHSAEVAHYQFDDLSNGQRDGMLRDSSGNHLHASGRNHQREDVRRIPCTELSTVAATDVCASGFVEPNRSPLGQTDQHEKARPSCFATELPNNNSQILTPSYPAFDFEYDSDTATGGTFTASAWVKPPAPTGGNDAVTAGTIITVVARGERLAAGSYVAITPALPPFKAGCLTRDCAAGYEMHLTRVCRIKFRNNVLAPPGGDYCPLTAPGVQDIGFSDNQFLCDLATANITPLLGIVSIVESVEYRWMLGFNAIAKFETDPVLTVPVPDVYAPVEILGFRTCASAPIGAGVDILTDGDDTFIEEDQWAHVAGMFDVGAVIRTVDSAINTPLNPTIDPAVITFENGTMRGWAPVDATTIGAAGTAILGADRARFADNEPLAIGNITDASLRRLSTNQPQNIFGGGTDLFAGGIDEAKLDDTADSTCETSCATLSVQDTTYSSATVTSQLNERITPPYPACPVRRRYVSYEDDYVQ